MKTRFFLLLKPTLTDRSIIALVIAILAMGLLYTLYVALSIKPTELQIATHYSAFGDTSFYRSKWHYMLVFVAFGLIATFSHVSIVLKLIRRDLRPLAVAFGWLTILLFVIAFAITHSVLSVAFLS